jgi:hypothetical protein
MEDTNDILIALVQHVFVGETRETALAILAPIPVREKDSEEKGPIQGNTPSQQSTHTRSTTSTPRTP